MKLDYLEVSVLPWLHGRGILEFRTMVRTEGKEYQYSTVVDENQFESLFDRLMEEARYRIKELIKKETKG